MTCARICLTCKSAGLAECPFKVGVALPLADAEKPKITFRNRVLLPRSTSPLPYSLPDDPNSWDPSGGWK